MKEFLLKDLAHARSGDKGDVSNICVFARDPRHYPALKKALTPEKVKQHFGPMVTGPVERYAVDSLQGLNFVLHGALDGGATQSLRLDTLGKCMASALLRLKITLDSLEEEI
jgi:hypothetical protein